jgi:hemoglobin-like flavoprotein
MTPSGETPLTPHEIALIRDSWKVLSAHGVIQVVEHFYATLFRLRPDLRLLFDANMGGQRCQFGEALDFAVSALDRPDAPVPAVEALGRRHAGFRNADQNYEVVGEALIQAFAELQGPTFDAKTRAAWIVAYRTLSGMMRRASAIVPV